jgi:hypothetical protein
MRKFLKLRSELHQQLSDVAREKAQLDYSVTMTKQEVHNNLTSTTSLVSSFAVGAVTGWFASAKKEPDVVVKVDADSTSHEEVSVSVKSSSIRSDLMNQIKALAMSIVMAEITKKASAMVDNVTQEDTSSSKAEQLVEPESTS